MTKKELKEKYTEWNIAIGALDKVKKDDFEKLQDLCGEKGDGRRWCSIEKLVEELAKTGHIYEAMRYAGDYYNIEGQKEALRNLAIATNNFEI